MGLKRKASFSPDENTPSISSPSPPLPPSSQGSTGSTTTAASSISSNQRFNLMNIAGAPYFNSRTRKRFRDGRPDEQTIHQTTLQKLFDAQKNTTIEEPDSVQRNALAPVQPEPRNYSEVDTIQGPAVMVQVARERNQRSLDSFFGGRSPAAEPPYTQVFQAPLPTSIYQPQESVPHLVPPHPRNLPSVLTCEDCGAPLLTTTTGEAVDAEMLDVGASESVDPEVDGEGWSCALCAKRVCDVCAVRGDYRVCLGCAVPGGGKYRPEELREKRWVGGIGWM